MTFFAEIDFKSLPAKYEDLVAFYPPRVIRDKVDYKNTTSLIDAMAGHKLTKDQDDYLELLSQIVETYEDEHLVESKPANPIETLKYLLAENGLTAEDLAGLLRVDRSQAFKILKGNRALTTEHIRKLCERFHVSADLFLA